METDFKGKRILVTGAGRGIGRELCKRLAKANAKVIALSKSENGLKTLKEEVAGVVETISVDLRNWKDTREKVEKALPIHALVNNAGVGSAQSFLEASPEVFDEVIDINTKAVLNVSQVVVKDMIQRGQGGCIVNISSQAGLVAVENHVVYSASKGALDAMTRVMALELGPHNIRVNSVNPTVVMTDMARTHWSDPAKADPLKAKIPLHRFADVEEVVYPIMFLLSSNASMISGTCLPIDGGFVSC